MARIFKREDGRYQVLNDKSLDGSYAIQDLSKTKRKKYGRIDLSGVAVPGEYVGKRAIFTVEFVD